jgi:hypothetical protein
MLFVVVIKSFTSRKNIDMICKYVKLCIYKIVNV